MILLSGGEKVRPRSLCRSTLFNSQAIRLAEPSSVSQLYLLPELVLFLDGTVDGHGGQPIHSTSVLPGFCPGYTRAFL